MQSPHLYYFGTAVSFIISFIFLFLAIKKHRVKMFYLVIVTLVISGLLFALGVSATKNNTNWENTESPAVNPYNEPI
jgi:high-affinity Fe2+/Pb2+ permease